MLVDELGRGDLICVEEPKLGSAEEQAILGAYVHSTGKSLGYYRSTGKSAFFLCLVLPCRGVPISDILILGGVSSFFSKKQKTDDL